MPSTLIRRPVVPFTGTSTVSLRCATYNLTTERAGGSFTSEHFITAFGKSEGGRHFFA